jgi:hypothetical protein
MEGSGYWLNIFYLMNASKAHAFLVKVLLDFTIMLACTHLTAQLLPHTPKAA